MSSINVINIKHPSASGNAITLAADGSAFINTGALGSRNRIINGDMRIDQRNAGASVSADGAYPVDRFYVSETSAGSFTAQRSTTAPAGFTNSLLFTTGTSTTPTGSDIVAITHHVEGFNLADLGWGTANARPATISFWVRSSLTGAFGFAIRSGTGDRSYLTSYSISAANTWEYKTISIPAETSGTFDTGNGFGCRIHWDLGVGSSYGGSTNAAWQSSNLIGLNGGTKVIGTAGATFYITGVQLEAGTVATAFERRPYGQELALCQRYFELGNLNGMMTNYIAGGYNLHIGFYLWKITKRAVPTVGTASVTNYQPGGGTGTASFGNLTTEGGKFDSGSTNQTFPTQFINGSVAFPISAEL